MSDAVNDSMVLAAMLHLPHAAAGRLAGAQAGAAAGFASRLSRLTADGANTGGAGQRPPGREAAAATDALGATNTLQAADAMRPGNAAEALAGLLDGHIAWQQRGALTAEASPEIATVPLPQVANTVATALYQGATRVHLQVTPPALGTVDVTVHLQAGVMQVVLQTETAETLEALQKDLPALRETLRGAGLNIGALRLACDAKRRFRTANLKRRR